MTKLPRLLLLILGLNAIAAAKGLCGVLAIPTTLTKAGSPHLIKGDLYVPGSSRLTIEAGAELIIAPTDSCKDLQQLDWADSQFVSIKIHGAFYVKGTSSEPVIIRPQNPKNGEVSWDGIRLFKQGSDYADVKFLHINGAHKAIYATNSSLGIKNSIFTKNNVGIWAKEQSKLQVHNNTFVQNLNSGIYTQNSTHSIVANIFAENISYGIWADSRKGVNINHNLFWKNGETDCFKCPANVLRMVQISAQGDSLDKHNNLRANPVFIGSSAELKLRRTDPTVATPKNQVKDQKVQAMHRRSDSLGLTGLDTKYEYKPWGKGSWLLSKYSPARHAAPDKATFYNPDSSRGDIGAWGALGQYKY
ncbi:MAG: right-handed parallel beta-helix repeat-containing protein [Fibrobacter sp.]|nr:right-handed parallel beta-helix repeat-containing protein [Fibrobacter sp.]